jgi:hypothetical protein
MEAIPVPPEILDHTRGAVPFEVPVAPRAIGGISGYRCKVYRARLNLETDRSSIAPPASKFPLFPKSSRLTAQ